VKHHNARNAALLSTALALAIALTACASAPPTETPGISGTITSLQAVNEPSADARVVLLVEGGPQPAGAVSDKASVTISDATDVFDASGKAADWQSLAQGQDVDVWFEGPVAESYPVQGRAGSIRIRP